jgi:glucose-6-phosphate dehydrogenase assembly protein OpcA
MALLLGIKTKRPEGRMFIGWLAERVSVSVELQAASCRVNHSSNQASRPHEC